jgi:hypothetical protein
MERRTCLKAMLASAGSAVTPALAFDGRPIQIHLDLAVDPAKERELVRFFVEKFRPAAAQQPGYVDLRLLKLQAALRGIPPPGANYQFVMTFASEELRQEWAATDLHKHLWPIFESYLTSKTYSRLLYEVY